MEDKETKQESTTEKMPKDANEVDLWSSHGLVMNEGEWDDKKVEPSFRLKPISLNVAGSSVNVWENKYADGITTKLEFAWKLWEKTSFYGYARKDWNEYQKSFNDWMELCANEMVKLTDHVDLDNIQFYWWNWSGKMFVWPKASVNAQIWNNVSAWAALWVYGTYETIPWQENKRSWSWIVYSNISVKQKDWKVWSYDWFINAGVDWSIYKEANLHSPNLLPPNVAWNLCWYAFARFLKAWWENLSEIKIIAGWVWVTYNFE